MKKDYLQLLAEAEKKVTSIFRSEVNPSFVFHNLVHTRRVVKGAIEIMNDSRIEGTNRYAVLLASWFHDTGFSGGHIENHEALSIKIAIDFLQQQQAPDDLIATVSACIAATRMPQAPVTLTEMIICDADLFHLGTNDFFDITALLRKELQWYFRKDFSDQEWDKGNLAFLSSHKYFTAYAQQHLEPVKQQWIKVLSQKIH
jgi:predicted metal-dependent HD superfamily phosphohydrolase